MRNDEESLPPDVSARRSYPQSSNCSVALTGRPQHFDGECWRNENPITEAHPSKNYLVSNARAFGPGGPLFAEVSTDEAIVTYSLSCYCIDTAVTLQRCCRFELHVSKPQALQHESGLLLQVGLAKVGLFERCDGTLP